MGTEIDRLELVVESQASKANKELDVLVSKLGNLDKVLSGIDFDNFKGSATVIEDLGKKVGDVGNQAKSTKLGVDTSGLKKNKKDLDAITASLKEGFKDVGKDLTFEGTYDQLLKEIQKVEKAKANFNEKERETHDVGGNRTSASYLKLQRNIAKTINYLDVLKSKLREIDNKSYRDTMDLFDRKEAEYNPSQTFSKSPEVARTVPRVKTMLASEVTPKVDTGTVINQLTELSAQAKRILSESLVDFDIDMDKVSFDEISSELAKLEAKYRNAQEAERKFLATGGNVNSQTYQGLIYQLELAAGKLDIAREKQEGFQNSISRTSKIANGFKSTVDGVVATVEGMGKGFKAVSGVATTLGKGLKAVEGVAKKASSTVSGLFKKLGGAGSQALKKFTGNLKFSLGQMLKMAMVRKLVNMAIMGIIQGFKVGVDNLAQYSNSFNNNISMIKSALTQLKNSFATAFAPILNVVAPILTTLINMLSKATTAIGMFFAALTGQSMFTKATPVTENYAAGLGSVGANAAGANKQAKELKKTLLGFDQINALSDNSGSGDTGGGGSGGGTGGGGVSANDMFKDVPVDSKIKEFADKIKEAWKTADFTEIGKIVGAKLNDALKNIPWDKIQKTLNKVAKSVATFLNGFIEETDWELVGATFAKGINTVFGMVNTFVTNFKWDKAGKALGDGINGFMNNLDWNLIRSTSTKTAKGIVDYLNTAIATVKWDKVGTTFGQAVNTVIDFFYTAVTKFDWKKAGKAIAESINGAVKKIDWAKAGKTLSSGVIGFLDMIGTAIEKTDWKAVGESVKDFLVNIDWKGVAQSLFKAIGAALGGLAAFLGGLLGDAFKGIGKYFQDKTEECGGNVVAGILKGIWDALVGIAKWVYDNIFKPIINGFKSAFGINSPSTVMAEQGGFIMSGLFGGLKDKLGTILTFFKELPGKIKNALGNAKNWLKEKGSDAIEGIKNGWESVRESKLGQAVSKIGGFVKDRIGDVKSAVTGRGREIIDGMKSGYDAIRESGLLSTVSKLRSTVKDRIGDVKSSVTSRGREIINGMRDGYNAVRESGLLSTVSNLRETIKTRIGNVSATVRSRGTEIITGLKAGYNNGASFTSIVAKLGASISTSIGSLWQRGRNVISGFITGFRSLKIPLPRLNFSSEEKTFAGIKFNIPAFKGVSWYAKGGFPNMGELFVANEAGPEMVGKMGNRNVVANNNQIVSGIKHGVSDAMVDVMMAMQHGQQRGNETIEIPLIIDGEELARSVHNGRERLIERGILIPEFA